jgi:hypothetical protein
MSLEPTAGRYRLAVSNVAFKLQLVVDGSRAWLKTSNAASELPAEAVIEYGERMHSESMALLYPALADDGYQFSLIPNARIGDRPVDGVLVKHDGRRDVRLYFDPQTRLLAKTGYSITESAKDIFQETVLEDYREIDGVQRPGRAIVSWDGAERSTREMSDFRAAERATDEFAEPK